jgi:hypothetical protein
MQLSDKPREKKYPTNSLKKHHMQGKIKLDDANTEKQSLYLLFLSSPINTWKYLQTKYRGQKQSTTGS